MDKALETTMTPEQANDLANQFKQIFSAKNLVNIIIAIVILVLGIIAARLIVKAIDKAVQKKNTDKTAARFLHAVFKIVLYCIPIFISAGTLGLDISILVALISVFTLAASLAAKDALANVAGGLILLATHQYRIGDYIEVKDQEGYVEDIKIVTTVLRNRNGTLISIPNGQLSASPILNYTRLGKRRVYLMISSSYTSGTEATEKAIMRAIEKTPHLENEPSSCTLFSFGENDIQYEVVMWVEPEQYWSKKPLLHRNIRDEFDAAGVEFSYPHVVVHTEK